MTAVTSEEDLEPHRRSERRCRRRPAAHKEDVWRRNYGYGHDLQRLQLAFL